MRVECPNCETSYTPKWLGIKTGPADKAVTFCVCGSVLEIVAGEPHVVPGVRSWRTMWMTKTPDTVSPRLAVRLMNDSDDAPVS